MKKDPISPKEFYKTMCADRSYLPLWIDLSPGEQAKVRALAFEHYKTVNDLAGELYYAHTEGKGAAQRGALRPDPKEFGG